MEINWAIIYRQKCLHCIYNLKAGRYKLVKIHEWRKNALREIIIKTKKLANVYWKIATSRVVSTFEQLKISIHNYFLCVGFCYSFVSVVGVVSNAHKTIEKKNNKKKTTSSATKAWLYGWIALYCLALPCLACLCIWVVVCLALCECVKNKAFNLRNHLKAKLGQITTHLINAS